MSTLQWSHLEAKTTAETRHRALADISRSSYVVKTTKPVQRLQICPIEGTPTIPPSYTRVRAVVWECGEGQTGTQTIVANIYFALATPYAKCNKS